MNDLPLALAGEQVLLLGEGALLRPADGALFLADLHLGKAATFRAAGIPVPFGTTDETLLRLDRLIERVRPRRLVILGDLWHARAGRHDRTVESVARWRAVHRDLPVMLVRGNHDRHAGDPDPQLGIAVHEGPVRDGVFALRHEPVKRSEMGEARGEGAEFWLAGHLHPAVEIRGRGRERMLLPCFQLRPDGLVLPAFGAFTGKGVIVPRPGDRIFVLAEGEVVEVA